MPRGTISVASVLIQFCILVTVFLEFDSLTSFVFRSWLKNSFSCNALQDHTMYSIVIGRIRVGLVIIDAVLQCRVIRIWMFIWIASSSNIFNRRSSIQSSSSTTFVSETAIYFTSSINHRIMKSSILLLVCLLKLTLASSVPFDPKLVNSTHEVRESPCIPWSDSSSLTLNTKSLTYVPTISNDNRGITNTFCQGRVDLYYRHRPNHMWIEVIPTLRIPFVRNRTTGQYIADPTKSCASAQVKQVYWPWGPSRPGFVAEFKKIFQAALSMKSSGPECLSKMGNLDAITSYLYAVAYDYFITLTA